MVVITVTKIFYKIGTRTNGVAGCFARMSAKKVRQVRKNSFAWCRFHTADGRSGFQKMGRNSQFWRTDGIYYQISDKKKLRNITI